MKVRWELQHGVSEDGRAILVKLLCQEGGDLLAWRIESDGSWSVVRYRSLTGSLVQPASTAFSGSLEAVQGEPQETTVLRSLDGVKETVVGAAFSEQLRAAELALVVSGFMCKAIGGAQ